MKSAFAAAALAAATAASAGSVAVGTPEELAAALAAAARDQSAPHEIAVKAGRYLLERPLEVSAVTGLVLRAERSGEVELCGGVKVTGWSRVEGTPFWAADAKGTDGKPTFFRALAKNGDWVKTAVVPGGTNRFEHSARFGAFLLPNLAGHWSRPPTDDENRVMPYDAKDIPDSMDLASADIHLLHMWSDSLCTVESIDRAAKVVKVKETPDWPMGAQGKFEYEIFNVREGMAPGRWFLDRRAGRVYYQPLPGEEVEKLDFIRPALRHVLVLNGGCDVRIEGIAFSGATPACGDGSGFGGISAPAAVVVRNVDRLALRGVEIRNTAGAGLNIGGSRDVVVDGCSISSCGACAAFISGGRVVVRRTLVGGAGLVHRASCGIFASGSDLLLAENEVRNVPYSGLIVFGERNRVETNFIHHVMQVLHDGAAVYGLFVDGAIRGNVVKDVVACGTGFGVHAYYADENSRNTVVEDNYAEGMPVPIHNHMSAGIAVRNNTLVNEHGDMVVSFEHSVGCTFAGNRIFCRGKLDTVWLDAISDWRGNVVSNGRDAPFEWNPPRVPQPRRGPVEVARAPKAPSVDGKFEDGEWEGDFFHIDRRGDGHQTGFSSALARFAWDGNSLYASFLAANFANGKMSFGPRWGKDDGVELDLGAGRKIRAFHDGSAEVLPSAFAGAVKVVALGKGKSGHSNPNLVRVEMSVPWKALGVEPKAGLKVPFAVRAYQSEFGQMKTYDSDAEPCELLLK